MEKLSVSDKEVLLHKASKDLILFGKLFLPNDFLHKSASPPFHYELGKKLISTKPGARICNVLPRGFGKSVLMKAAIMHKLCFTPEDKAMFMAWVAEEQGQSIDHIKYIRSHLENNHAIRYYFGNLCGSDTGKRWTEKDLVTNKGHRIIAKGTSQRLRGRAEVDTRYTGIILDDFESELNTKTAIRRDEIKQWIVSTVYPALEESPGKEGWIWLSGTIVHYDAFLQNIVDGWRDSQKHQKKYPWDVTFIRAIEDGKPAWEEQFPLSKLNQKRQEYIEAGKIDKFAQEYLNDARDASSATFQMDNIRYHNYEFYTDGQFAYLKNEKEMIPIYTYMGVDLAHTASKVYLVHRRNQLRASKIMQDRVFANPKIEMVWNSEIAEIYGQKHLESIQIKNIRTGEFYPLEIRGLFIAIGHTPNSAFVRDLVQLDSNGYIETSRAMETSCPGVYAAGDVQDPKYRQAITAAASGCIAALEIERSLD